MTFLPNIILLCLFHSQKNIPGSRMPISCSWASVIRRSVPITLGSNAAYPERNFTIGAWYWQRALPDSSFLFFLEEGGNNRIFVKYSPCFWKNIQSGDGGKKGGHKQEVQCNIGLYSCSQWRRVWRGEFTKSLEDSIITWCYLLKSLRF